MRDLKIKILDSILHGDLKPWKIDASDQRRFTELVKAATATSPQTYGELQKQLATLLDNYPSLQKIVAGETQTGGNPLVQHYFKTELPKYNDPLTQFYYSIITKEALRFFNQFLLKSENWIDPIDIHFQVNKTLTDIRVLATQTAEELAQRGFVSFPDKLSDFVHIVLFTLKQMLTALFFEVQERFAKQLSQNTTEEFYYLHYLKEPSPATPALIPDTAYFEFHFQLIQKAPEFSKVDALHLLKQMQQHQSNNSLNLQSALENLIFLHSQDIEIEIGSIKQLSDFNFTKQYFEAARTMLFAEINKNNYGYERLEIIQNRISELDYVASVITNKHSIPSILFNWLVQQQEVYKANANAVFSKDINADVEAARLKNPLSKKNKATIEQQKQYAKEHLAFMSGYNIKNEKIMPDADFNRMMEYTYFLIEKEKLPPNIKVIHKTGFASNAIRYTFYKIHEYLYGTQSIKQIWINFLHAVFLQFNGTTLSTTKVKFSEKPKSYEGDLEKMKR